ncbi:MAG TPA: MMPL family transporter, partial [Actinomycetota bacterium]|nr:MMPL family transporter [Actinomycetota bacterium]
MRRLASWSFHHRRIVVASWLAALVISFAITRAVGTGYSNDFTLPSTESTRALELLQTAAPQEAGDTEQVVIGTQGAAKVTDPAVQKRVEAMLADVAKLPHVVGVVSPYSPAGAAQVSPSGTVAFASVTLDRQAQDLSIPYAKDFVATATDAGGGGVVIAVSGQLASWANEPAIGGTGLGIITAGIVLFLVFGSLFAMAMPLASALVALGTAIQMIGLFSNVMRMPEFSTELVMLIGLGVGVDYALFIVSRHRQGLQAGRDPASSVELAMDTSGRAVLFAGAIVCVALLGMFALGVKFLYGMTVAASIGVLFTMVAALTFLPAMLGFVGPRILSRRQRRKLATDGHRPATRHGFWARWSRLVERRPVLYGGLALLVIGLLATPFFSLRLGLSDQGNDPEGSTTRTAYDLLARGFGPGFNGPLQVVAETTTPAQAAAMQELATTVQGQPNVAAVTPVTIIPARDGSQVELFVVYPVSAPQDEATTDLIDRLRADVIPASMGSSGTAVYVGGVTAIFADFAAVLNSKLPVFIGAVVLLSFLLLMMVLRSLLVPLKAAVMNLISIAAAFGIVTAVFQWGWLGGLVGVHRPGPVEAFLPVMLFSILFGLSMDYEVFLVMRIHEEWLRTGDNREAVRRGLSATGGTITAAAAIMIVVFGSFILGGQRVIKEFGIGLSAAILVDAVIIRTALVPAIMLLMGEANWWFPRWLDGVLPRIHVEPEDLSELDEE